MQLIDSHTHLYLPEFDNDRDQVIERALAAGVTRMLLPNINGESVGPMLNLAENYPGVCLPMIGVHPTSISSGYRNELDVFYESLEKKCFVAIGEIGIDLYWDKTYKDEQITAFKEQVKTADRENLPVVIHSRESLELIIELLDETGLPSRRGVFHAFTGNEEQAGEIIKRGFKIGLGGILTFRNSDLGTAIRNISLENIILETDSPYLAPVPERGKRNESSYLTYTAGKLAEIKGLSIEEIADVTTANCIKLFNLD